MSSITCDDLLQWQQTKEFALIDVRLRNVKTDQPLSIAGSIWLDPEHLESWITSVRKDCPVIVFCAHGRSVSQGIAAQLNAAGFESHYLEGGLAAWIEKGQVTC